MLVPMMLLLSYCEQDSKTLDRHSCQDQLKKASAAFDTSPRYSAKGNYEFYRLKNAGVIDRDDSAFVEYELSNDNYKLNINYTKCVDKTEKRIIIADKDMCVESAFSPRFSPNGQHGFYSCAGPTIVEVFF